MVMSSALLASRTEPCWGERKVYTRTDPNPNPKILPNPNPSPNSTPPPPRHDDHGDSRQNHLQTIEPAALPTSPTSAAASDDSYSSLRKPKPLLYRKETGRYVTYNISNYSKGELRELKRKLVSELELVRRVTSRIESTAARSVPVVGSIKKKPPPPSAEMKKVTAGMMKRCSQILTKLMKHAGAVWFRAPVDVVALKLYDYHQIIKNPMDLGTARSRLSKGLYPTPVDFAADVRLTFNNALIYNPPGHEVHMFAGLLLRQFESSFTSAYQRYEKQLAAISRAEEEQRGRIASSWSRPLPERQTTPVAIPSPEQSVAPPAAAVPMVGMGRKQAKKRRAMTLAEKERLTSALEEVPEERTEELLQIIRKRNAEMVESSSGDGEVELDFELMDNETLWELARFVSNKCSSSMKKLKRREGLDESVPQVMQCNASPSMAAKGDEEEEEENVEICDEDDLPVTNYPSMQIEKEDTGYNNNNNNNNKTSNISSSSSSDSSSSSSSDGSSSGGSDDDDAQSPAPRN